MFCFSIRLSLLSNRMSVDYIMLLQILCKFHFHSSSTYTFDLSKVFLGNCRHLKNRLHDLIGGTPLAFLPVEDATTPHLGEFVILQTSNSISSSYVHRSLVCKPRSTTIQVGLSTELSMTSSCARTVVPWSMQHHNCSYSQTRSIGNHTYMHVQSSLGSSCMLTEMIAIAVAAKALPQTNASATVPCRGV
jgi:hypothetical protein